MPKSGLSREALLASGLFSSGIALEIAEKLVTHSGAPSAGFLAPMAVGANALLHVGVHLIASIIERTTHAREAAVHLLTNGDIAHTQAKAIRRRLEYVADRLDQPTEGLQRAHLKAQRKRLLAIAAAADAKENGWWFKAVQNPFRHELGGIRDPDIVNLVAAYISGQKPAVLDAKVWEQLLNEGDAVALGGPKLDPVLVPVIAQQLEGNLAADFFEAIKADVESSGKTYAAVSLRFSGEILLQVRALTANQAELSKQSRELLEALEKALPHLNEDMKQIAAAVARFEVVENLPSKLKSELADVEQRLRSQLERMEDILNEVLALVREVLRRFNPARDNLSARSHDGQGEARLFDITIDPCDPKQCMKPTIEVIPGPQRPEEVSRLKEMYKAAGARMTPDGRFELPAPKDPARAAILNEQAIARLRSHSIYKRNHGKPPAPQLQQAFELLQEAAALNLGVGAECFNYGCCCYYMNLIDSGRMFFNLILDQTKRERQNPEFEKVLQYFAAFYNHVVIEHCDSIEHARAWLEGEILVNPDFFMSRRNPNATAPERPVIDPDTLL
jgi:hypothetical protein